MKLKNSYQIVTGCLTSLQFQKQNSTTTIKTKLIWLITTSRAALTHTLLLVEFVCFDLNYHVRTDLEFHTNGCENVWIELTHKCDKSNLTTCVICFLCFEAYIYSSKSNATLTLAHVRLHWHAQVTWLISYPQETSRLIHQVVVSVASRQHYIQASRIWHQKFSGGI